MTEALNTMQKYVVSRTLREPLPWVNSTLLKDNVPEAVAELKAQADENLDIVIMGSGELIQTLMKHNLIDRYVLLIHPIVLASGQRLFSEDSSFATLQLVSAKPTPTGVIVATYEPGQPPL